MNRLQQLKGVQQLPATFLEHGSGFDASDYTVDFPGRDIDIDPLVNVVEEAMRRFGDHPAASDAWLAPRAHHLLRLTRREAALRGVWAWLAVVALPEFVHWRFPGNKGITAVDRYLGREDKNAVGRLWWGAELMRNGADYTPVTIGFSLQDVPNTWMRYNAFHSRPLAQAVLQQLWIYNHGQPATSDQVGAVAKAVNTAARTVLLDAVATDEPLDLAATRLWIDDSSDVDETDLYEADPEGPQEEGVPETSIKAMAGFVSDVIIKMPAQLPRMLSPEPEE